MRNKPVIFLCGSLRSGTTLMHLMMGKHPELVHPGEFDFLFDYLKIDEIYRPVGPMGERLLSDRIFRTKGITLSSESKTRSALVKDMVTQLVPDNKFICLNLHRNFEIAHAIFPTAKFIFLNRDPRDVARSSIGMGWAGNVYYGVDHWVDTQNSWLDCKKLLVPDQAIEVTFEQLIIRPVETLSTLCQFIGIEYDPEMLAYAKASGYGPPDPRLVNQWKERLSVREIELVGLKASSVDREMLYEGFSNDPAGIKVMERSRLWIGNRVYKERFKYNRYGLLLYLCLKISRVLKTRKLTSYVSHKKDQIDITHLR